MLARGFDSEPSWVLVFGEVVFGKAVAKNDVEGGGSEGIPGPLPVTSFE